MLWVCGQVTLLRGTHLGLTGAPSTQMCLQRSRAHWLFLMCLPAWLPAARWSLSLPSEKDAWDCCATHLSSIATEWSPDVAQSTWILAVVSTAYFSDTRTGARPRPPRPLPTKSLGPLVGPGDNFNSVYKGQAGVGFGKGRVARGRGHVPYPAV